MIRKSVRQSRSLRCLVWVAALAATSAFAAPAPVDTAIPGEVPVGPQPMRLSERDPGEGAVWQEDVGRIEEGTFGQLPPEFYMEALRELGLADHLRDRALNTADKAGESWERIGPIGGYGTPVRNGRISGIEVLQDGAFYRVYAGACQGGLWYTRSSNFSVWYDIGANLPNPSVRAFAVDPDDFDHIFVGTGDHRRYDGAGLFETTDGGATWTQVSLPLGIGTPKYFYRLKYLGLDGSARERMAAVTSNGPIWSADGGATWQHGEKGSTPVGGFWTDIAQWESPNVLYAVCCDETVNGDSGVYVSLDYGENWSRLNNGILPTSDKWSRASLAMADSNPAQVVVMVTTGNVLEGVYRGLNGGLAWENITHELIDTGSGYSFGGSQVWHAQAVAIDPADPDHILVAGVDLAESTDGGATWDIGEGQHGINIGHVDFTQLNFFEATGDDMMWMGNDGGIYYHRFNNGNTYGAMGDHITGLACSEIDYMDVKRLMLGIGLQDNGTLLSFDGAATWDYLGSGDGADVEIIDPVGGDIFYNNGVHTSPPSWRTFRLYNGGSAEFTNNPAAYMPRLYSSPFTGLVYTQGGTGLYSMYAHGSLSWTLLHDNWQGLPYGIRNIWSSYAREEGVWITYWRDSGSTTQGDEDLTYVYRDGANWTHKHWENFNPSGGPVALVAPSREWPDEAWVGVYGDPGDAKIFHLREGGDEKDDITGNLTGVSQVRAIEVMPFNPDVIWAGTDLGVFQTTDGGATWTPFMDGLPIGRCTEMHLIVDHNHTGPHYLYLAMDGRGVWKREIPMPHIIYVEGQTFSSGDGSFWGPFKTVAEAVAAAPAGAIIAIHTNDYDEPQTIDRDVKLVTWGGETYIH